MDDLEHVSLGADHGRGNLLGVQPALTPAHNASAEALRAALNPYLHAARAQGWLGPRTLVVFPEYVGTWLAAAGQGAPVRAAPTVAAALRRVARNNFLAYGVQMMRSPERDRATAALFRLQADVMAFSYQAVFSGLARDHAVTVVAGSLILPNPRVESGRVRPGQGPLYNTSAVFGPDGAAHPALVRKTHLTTAEQPHLTPAPVAGLPVFDTPAGRLGVLICADSWYPAAYAPLQQQGAELLAVPSFVSAQGHWHRPWAGYDGHPAPADVDPSDVGSLTEGQAWRKYALASRLPLSGARAGLNVFLRGQFWDLTADGGTALAVSSGGIAEAGQRGAALLNLWL
jgi:predicted amidohydrolase